MKATETRRGRGSARRWRWMVAVSVLGAMLVVIGPARSAAPSSVSAVQVVNSSPSAAGGARTVYVVTFTTSGKGSLSSGSEITLVFPSGTGLGSVFTSSVDDTTTGANGLGACNPPSGETITCFLNTGSSIAAGDSVRVTLNGVTNPTTPSASLTVSVSTTSDTTPANSAPYTVVSPSHISQPTVNNSSPSAAAGARTTYVVAFTTSSTGGLSNAAGSEITLVFPAGTGLGSVVDSSVDDTTTGVNDLGTCNPTSGQTITCFLDSGTSIAAGDSVRVTLDGVRNPSTPSASLTMSASTTSDIIPVKSVPYAVGPPPPVPGKSVDVGPVSGVVFVKRPGQKVFVRLRAGEQIPLGSQINTSGGVVLLVVATNPGQTARAQAYGGVFRVTQKLAEGTELTVLALAGPKPTGCGASAARAAGSARTRHRAVTVRDPGDFLTRGIYASATDGQVAGITTWLTEDSCAGTLIRVVRGAVLVHDFPHHREFPLGAGHSFLAHPGKGG